jgi:lipopolysaccharide export LptBFGC system permease protein LptF
VIFFPLAVLLMGVLAFVIGLINLLGSNKQNLMALIAMVLGLVVILLAVLEHI